MLAGLPTWHAGAWQKDHRQPTTPGSPMHAEQIELLSLAESSPWALTRYGVDILAGVGEAMLHVSIIHLGLGDGLPAAGTAGSARKTVL